MLLSEACRGCPAVKPPSRSEAAAAEVFVPLRIARRLAESTLRVLIALAGERRRLLFLLRMITGPRLRWIYGGRSGHFLDGHVRAFAHLWRAARIAYDTLRRR